MARKSDHRSAFASDPRFLKRLARQGGNPPLPARQADSGPGPQTGKKECRPSVAKSRMQKVRGANMESRFDTLDLDYSTGALTAMFPGALLLSLNVMLRTHDAAGTALKATWQKRVEALRLENAVTFRTWIDTAAFPLLVEEIYVTPEAGLLDVESVSGGCKPIIDAFVSCGFLPDDSRGFIAQPLAYTERGTTGGLMLRFTPSPRPWGLIADASVERARELFA